MKFLGDLYCLCNVLYAVPINIHPNLHSVSTVFNCTSAPSRRCLKTDTDGALLVSRHCTSAMLGLPTSLAVSFTAASEQCAANLSIFFLMPFCVCGFLIYCVNTDVPYVLSVQGFICGPINIHLYCIISNTSGLYSLTSGLS